MNKTLKEILENINLRFPIGREATRTRLMIDGVVPFDGKELKNNLEQIKKFGGSDKIYTSINDQIDVKYYLKQFTEFLRLQDQN